ncbi:hypothetical protein [Rhodovarius lipocyclicus]|uniref:hypothetical protein n=1 Tax=Rhodovarius lipocyclicus TaxID=268410 RepID=UPI001356E076|nr:hypothetical protein [Rhodovarius lipocyclicus]
MGSRFLPLVLVLGTMGCAELQRRPVIPPAALTVPGDPVRGQVSALADAFGDGGQALNGHPAAMAQAVARNEQVLVWLDQDPRFNSFSEAVRQQLEGASREQRGALGMAESVPRAQAIAGLLATRRALLAGDDAAARAALGAITNPEGLPPLERLARMGGLPQSAIATTLLREEVTRLDAENAWRGVRGSENAALAITTPGLGGNTDR